jgi:hypothetical protein
MATFIFSRRMSAADMIGAELLIAGTESQN